MSAPLRRLVDIIAGVLATGLGSGYSPLAPGTAGSLLACLILWFLVPALWWAQLAAITACFAAGVAVSAMAEKWWGHDPPKVVIDEVAGQWLALFLVPRNPVLYALGFLLFRAFDIIKPLGARRIQSAPAGWGVMLDDVLAGIYSNIVMQAVLLAFYRQGSQLANLLGWR